MAQKCNKRFFSILLMSTSIFSCGLVCKVSACEKLGFNALGYLDSRIDISSLEGSTLREKREIAIQKTKESFDVLSEANMVFSQIINNISGNIKVRQKNFADELTKVYNDLNFKEPASALKKSIIFMCGNGENSEKFLVRLMYQQDLLDAYKRGVVSYKNYERVDIYNERQSRNLFAEIVKSSFSDEDKVAKLGDLLKDCRSINAIRVRNASVWHISKMYDCLIYPDQKYLIDSKDNFDLTHDIYRHNKECVSILEDKILINAVKNPLKKATKEMLEATSDYDSLKSILKNELAKKAVEEVVDDIAENKSVEDCLRCRLLIQNSFCRDVQEDLKNDPKYKSAAEVLKYNVSIKSVGDVAEKLLNEEFENDKLGYQKLKDSLKSVMLETLKDEQKYSNLKEPVEATIKNFLDDDSKYECLRDKVEEDTKQALKLNLSYSFKSICKGYGSNDGALLDLMDEIFKEVLEGETVEYEDLKDETVGDKILEQRRDLLIKIITNSARSEFVGFIDNANKFSKSKS